MQRAAASKQDAHEQPSPKGPFRTKKLVREADALHWPGRKSGRENQKELSEDHPHTPVGISYLPFFIFSNEFRENLPIPIPIRRNFELINLTDTDSYPPSGIRRPQNYRYVIPHSELIMENLPIPIPICNVCELIR